MNQASSRMIPGTHRYPEPSPRSQSPSAASSHVHAVSCSSADATSCRAAGNKHAHRCMHPLAHAWRCCTHASTHMHTHMHTHMQAHAHCRTRTRIRTLAIVGTLHQYVRIHSSGRMAGNRQWTSTPAGLSYRSSLSAFGTNRWSGKPVRHATGSKYSTVHARTLHAVHRT